MAILKGPTTEELKATAARLALTLPTPISISIGLIDGTVGAYEVVATVDEAAGGEIPTDVGTKPSADENRHNAWYRKTDQRRRGGQACRQAGRHQGQRHGGRRADDERRRDAGRLCAGLRCNRRHPAARRRRRDRRQDALRMFLPLRRQPYQRDRTGPQSVEDGLFGRRIVVRQCRRGGA